MSSENGTAFYAPENFNSTNVARAKDESENYYDNYYYVFNYGYAISAWQISFVFTETDGSTSTEKNYYFVLNSIEKADGIETYEWKITTEETNFEIPISTLNGETFANLAKVAEEADQYFAGKDPVGITLKPVWEEANIIVKEEIVDEQYNYTYNEYWKGEYNEKDYQLKTSLSSTLTGKSLLAYTYDNKEEIALIPTKGEWNFEKISTKYFSYGTTIGTVVYYSLDVSPVYLDDICKVYLNGVDGSANDGETTYKITSGDYSFSTTYNQENSTSSWNFKNLYYHGSFDEFYEYANWPTKGSIDDYVAYLAELKNAWDEGLFGGANGFSLFKTIYFQYGDVGYTSEMVSKDSKEFTTSEDLTFWIYLANGQKTGNLPVIEKPNYTMIFWLNENQDIDEKTYAYLTEDYDESEHSAELTGYKVHDDGAWYLSDGYYNRTKTASKQAFVAHYYRKNYLLEVQTLLDNKLSRNGYAVIDIKDLATTNNKSGSYLVVYDTATAKMKIYSNFTAGNLSKGFSNEVNEIKLYADCILTKPRCCFNGNWKF